MRFGYYLRITAFTLFVFMQVKLLVQITRPLIGVSIVLQGTSMGVAIDIESKFRISGIPARAFNVKVSYIGYEAKIIEVDFAQTKRHTLILN